MERVVGSRRGLGDPDRHLENLGHRGVLEAGLDCFVQARGTGALLGGEALGHGVGERLGPREDRASLRLKLVHVASLRTFHDLSRIYRHHRHPADPRSAELALSSSGSVADHLVTTPLGQKAASLPHTKVTFDMPAGQREVMVTLPNLTTKKRRGAHRHSS